MAPLRFVLLTLHLVRGALTILFIFPWSPMTVRNDHLCRWSRSLLRIVNVRVTRSGTVPSEGFGALVVANHVSWLDIAVLHSQIPCQFVSKAEVAKWPLIGWMANQTGTLFLAREHPRDAQRITQEMAGVLAKGARLAVFPEGTTSDGRSLGTFYAALFEPAVKAGVPVFPAVIRYLDARGKLSHTAAYYGDMSLWQSLKAILYGGPFTVDLSFLEPVSTESVDRRCTAKATEAVIRAHLSGAAPDTTP